MRKLSRIYTVGDPIVISTVIISSLRAVYATACLLSSPPFGATNPPCVCRRPDPHARGGARSFGGSSALGEAAAPWLLFSYDSMYSFGYQYTWSPTAMRVCLLWYVTEVGSGRTRGVAAANCRQRMRAGSAHRRQGEGGATNGVSSRGQLPPISGGRCQRARKPWPSSSSSTSSSRPSSARPVRSGPGCAGPRLCIRARPYLTARTHANTHTSTPPPTHARATDRPRPSQGPAAGAAAGGASRQPPHPAPLSSLIPRAARPAESCHAPGAARPAPPPPCRPALLSPAPRRDPCGPPGPRPPSRPASALPGPVPSFRTPSCKYARGRGVVVS